MRKEAFVAYFNGVACRSRLTQGIEQRDGPYWLTLTSFAILRRNARLSHPTAENTNCVRTYACMCARILGIRYREFGIYERNDRSRFGDQYRARLRVLMRVHFGPPRWIRNVEKHSEVSLVKSRPRQRTEFYRPEQFNRTLFYSSFTLFFFMRNRRANIFSYQWRNDDFSEPFNGFWNAFVGLVKSSTNQLKCDY